MIVTQHKDRVETGGLQANSGATILATGHAFEILSSGLYPDKPKAILREISNNAYDAHVAAGIADTPILVVLPNDFEPELVIRDYGFGLSHDKMMKLYVTYFGSEKSSSNDFIGGLGLGSKSPWAYTKQFIVVSRHEGVKCTYSAYIGEDGCPGIALMHEEPNDDVTSGLEVRVPIKREDFRTFAGKVSDVYTYWPVKPTIKGWPNISISEVSYAQRGQGWGLRKVVTNYYGEAVGDAVPRAIMGTSSYPIEKQHFSDLTDDQKKLFDLAFDLWFPIGDLKVAPSREGLQYTKQVQEAILKRLTAAGKDVVTSYEKVFDGVRTLWEARVALKERIENGGLPRHLKELVSSRLRFQGQVLSKSDLTLDYELNHEGLTFLDLTSPYDRNRQKNWHDSGSKRVHVSADPSIKFIWDDRSKMKLVDRLQYHFGTNTPLFVIRTNNPSHRDKVIVQLGNPEWYDINAMEEPPKEFNKRERSAVRKLLSYVTGGWHDTSHDVEKGGLYVPLYNGETQAPTSGPNAWSTFLTKLCDLGIKPDESIFGIQATYRNIPNRYDGWRNIHDEIKAKLPAIMEQMDFEQALGNLNEYVAHRNNEVVVAASLVRRPAKASSKMRKLQDGIEAVNVADQETRLRALEYLCKVYEIPFEAKKPAADLGKLVTAVEKKYPMLKLLGYNLTRPSCAEQVADYIDMADRSR